MTSLFFILLFLLLHILFQDMCGSGEVLTFPCSFSLILFYFIRKIEKIIIN